MGRLFLRIFLWFWAGSTLLLLVLVAGFLIFQPDPDALASWRLVGRGAISAVGSMAASTYERDGPSAVAGGLAGFSRDADLRVWLYGPGAELLSGPSVGYPPLPALSAGGVGNDAAHELVLKAFAKDEAESRAERGMILVARRVNSDSGKDYVVLWEAPSRLGRRLLTPRFSLRMISLVFTGGLVCLWLTWHITRPIRTLRGATRRFSQGDLAVRVADKDEFHRGDELSDLAQDFDVMAVRIEALIKSQQQLLADISHELRSPLARVSLALDLARRRLGDDVPEHQRIDREVHRLNDLIEQLLTLARLQGEPGNSRSESVDLGALVREIADDARFEAAANNKTVVVRRDCDATIRGSRALLRSAIENVVRNAVRHTPENTEVAIDMSYLPESARVAINVSDHGPGVPPAALERLFDPFFRVEEGRDRDTGGVGLGLAIVRQATLFHGGSVSAQNRAEGGLLVRLEFPTETIPQ